MVEDLAIESKDHAILLNSKCVFGRYALFVKKSRDRFFTDRQYKTLVYIQYSQRRKRIRDSRDRIFSDGLTSS